MYMKRLLIQLFCCICLFGVFMYLYLDRQNELTHLRIQIPKVTEENHLLCEEVARLQYLIDRFEDPQHLMELATLPEYKHLKHPYFHNVLTVKEGFAINQEDSKEASKGFSLSIPIGKQ